VTQMIRRGSAERPGTHYQHRWLVLAQFHLHFVYGVAN
jgi:hypothetical protein